MNDQVFVRMVYGSADRLKKRQPLPDVQAVEVAVCVHPDAVDVFHHQVWHTVPGRAAVEQSRDIGMIEVGQDLAFVLQSKLGLRIDQPVPAHLDCNELVELLIRAFGKVYDTHAARTQRAQHAVRTDHLAGELLRGLGFVESAADCVAYRLVEPRVQVRAALQQCGNILAKLGVVVAGFGKIGTPATRRQPESCLEQRLGALPAIRAQFNRCGVHVRARPWRI